MCVAKGTDDFGNWHCETVMQSSLLCQRHDLDHEKGRPYRRPKSQVKKCYVCGSPSRWLRCDACETAAEITRSGVCRARGCRTDSLPTAYYCLPCENSRRLDRTEAIRILPEACSLCGSGDRLHVDHDHSCHGSGKGYCRRCIRGVLCADCNMNGISWYERKRGKVPPIPLFETYLTAPRPALI